MESGRRKDRASRPWRLSSKLLIVFALATVIGFSAICVSVILEMRRGEEELAHQSLENLASSIDADIDRNVELYDLSLRDVASRWWRNERHFRVDARQRRSRCGRHLPRYFFISARSPSRSSARAMA